MKKLFALPLTIAFLCVPALALADTGIPTGPTPLQLLTRTAALEAQLTSLQTGQALSCAMLFSASTTRVGQEVALAWGSTGAVEQTGDPLNMRPTAGAVTMLFTKPGTWTYPFVFYSAAGGSAKCSAQIVVTT